MSCEGFEEDLVLSVKTCFLQSDIRQILIVLHRGKTVFHHRDCLRNSFERRLTGTSEVCDEWFRSIKQIPDGHEKSGRETRNEEKEKENIGPSISSVDDDNASDNNDTKTEKSKFDCDFCSKQFVVKDSLTKHIWRLHRQDMKTKRSSRQGKHSCKVCGLRFDKKQSLYKHISRKHFEEKSDRKKENIILSESFTETKLNISTSSDNKSKRNPIKRVFICEFCGLNIMGASSYQFHKSGHTEEKKFKCATCSKSYRTSTDMFNCQRGHRDIYKWRCDQCSFKSHQKNKYIRHLRVHSKSKPYSCPCCQHKTSRKDYLQKHVIKEHCSPTVSLSSIESVNPEMYSIKEQISIVSPIKYTKDDMMHPPLER